MLVCLPVCMLVRADVVEIDPEGARTPLGPHLEYSVEQGPRPGEGLPRSIEFAAYSGKVFNLGLERRPIWVRVAVRNADAQPREWVLSLNRALLDELEIWVDRGGTAGLLLDQSERSARSVYQEFGTLATRLALAGGESAAIYVRFVAPNSSTLDLRLESTDAFEQRQSYRMTVYVVSLAGVATLAFYNFILFFLTGLRPFTYYAIAQLVAFVYFSHLGGVTSVYLWPDDPVIGRALSAPLATAVSLFMCLFARGFLDTARHAPRIDKFLSTMIYALAVVVVGALLFQVSGIESRTVLNTASVVLTSVTWLVLPVVGIRYLLFGEARFVPVAIAWCLLGFVAIYTSLSLAGVVPVWSDYLIGYSIFIFSEALLIAVSLALWVRDLQRRSIDVEQQLAQQLELKLAESEKARALAEERNLAIQELAEQGRLLQAAGHDSRQMLGAMRYFARGLAGSIDEVRTGIASDAILKLTDHLDGVLSTTVGTSQGGGLNTNVLAIEEVQLADVFESLRMIYQRSAAADGTILRFRTLPMTVVTDRVLLLRVVSNLVGNAVKYAAGGLVIVTGRIRHGEPWIEVRDNGPGIDPSLLASQLAPDALARRGGVDSGTGNGLRIARRLSESFGGILEAMSAPGRGATLRLRLPIASLRPADCARGRVNSVLIFDTHRPDAEALQALLTELDPGIRIQLFDSSSAFDGNLLEADLALIDQHCSANGPADIVAQFNAATAVALTTHDRGADVRNEAGAVAQWILYKPITRPALLFLLWRLNEDRSADQAPAFRL